MQTDQILECRAHGNIVQFIGSGSPVIDFQTVFKWIWNTVRVLLIFQVYIKW